MQLFTLILRGTHSECITPCYPCDRIHPLHSLSLPFSLRIPEVVYIYAKLFRNTKLNIYFHLILREKKDLWLTSGSDGSKNSN